MCCKIRLIRMCIRTPFCQKVIIQTILHSYNINNTSLTLSLSSHTHKRALSPLSAFIHHPRPSDRKSMEIKETDCFHLSHIFITRTLSLTHTQAHTHTRTLSPSLSHTHLAPHHHIHRLNRLNLSEPHLSHSLNICKPKRVRSKFQMWEKLLQSFDNFWRQFKKRTLLLVSLSLVLQFRLYYCYFYRIAYKQTLNSFYYATL